MGGLTIVRLLQNPLGQVAGPGERADIIQVSDGLTKIYLDPEEFARATEGQLYSMLARERTGTSGTARQSR